MTAPANPAPSRPAAMPPLLTARQLAALRLTANGHTIRSAARAMGKSEYGVADLLRRAYERLGVRSSAHGVAVALVLGLIGLDEIRVPERQGGAVSAVEASGAPGPRRDAAGRSGGDGTGFNGAGKPQTAGCSGDSPASEAENALRGGSPGLAASARPSLRPSP